VSLVLKKYFLSKKSAKKTIALGYFFSVFSFFIGMMLYEDYKRYGYFRDRGVTVHGNDAFITAIAVMAASVALFLFTIYATAIALFFMKRSDFTKNPPRPEVLICGKCQSPVSAEEVMGTRCPKYGTELEDVKGFYRRHPDLK